MNIWWSAHAALGESVGSLILAITFMFTQFVVKSNKLSLTTTIQKRGFLSVGYFSGIVLGILTAKGFGGHGQVNPSITLLVAGMEGHFEAVPFIIGFQLLGAFVGAIIFILTIRIIGRNDELSRVFRWSQQSPQKTMGLEVVGNVFWLLPIAGLLLFFTSPSGVISLFEVAMAAAFGKVLLTMVMDDFGSANFNPMVWFGLFLVKLHSQKGISGKEFITEFSGVVTTLLVGLAAGGIAYGSLQITN